MNLNAIRADLAVSISELKKNPSGVMKEANGRVVAVLSHNKPQSYLVPAALFEQLDLDELLEDLQLAAVVKSRMQSKAPPVKVELSDL
ncbi:MAG TPA: type II toxin-antitoxin system prevent-host-death family antitoxin [Fontimonas sp.]